MARKRMIDPGIWQSATFESLPNNDARVLLFWLITNPDDEGRLRCSLPVIRAGAFTFSPNITEANIAEWLELLAQLDFLVLYDAEGSTFIQIQKWVEWQKIDRPTPSHHPACIEGSAITRRLISEPSTKARRRLVPNRMEWNGMEQNGIEGERAIPAPPASAPLDKPEPEYPAELIEAVRIATRNPDKQPGPRDVETWRFLQKASNLERGKGFTPIEILETVRAMRNDAEPEMSGFCWSQQLQSFANLSKRSRKGELTKFENAYGKLFVKIQKGIEQRQLDARYAQPKSTLREAMSFDAPLNHPPPPSPQPDLPAITPEKRDANLTAVMALTNKLAREKSA
jgi:hypothetical protein